MRRPILETVKSISCQVFVVNFKKYSKFKWDTNVKSHLCLYCKNILLNEIVESNSRIDLSPYKLSKVYGIHHILVAQLITKNNAASGIITESTKFQISAVHSEEFYRLSLEIENIPDLGGLDAEFDKIERLFSVNRLASAFYRPHGILLHGPPGCGKTSFARSLAKKCGATFYSVDSAQLLTSEFGSGAHGLRVVFQKGVDLVEEGPVILFLDEMDTLCPRPETASVGSRQLSNALMAEMDRIHSNNTIGFLILAATNSISNIHPGLRRPGRFDQEILINVPSEAQRLSILQVLTETLTLSSDVSCQVLSQMTPGFVGADLRGLCEEAVNQCQSQDGEEFTAVTMDHFYRALHTSIPSLTKGSQCLVDYKPVQWEDIAGLDQIKAQMKQSIEWPLKYPDILSSMDVPPTRGILLYGPPGCCKTTLVRAAATSCNVSFLSLSGAQVYSAFVGESERLISQAFQQARAVAPSILFFDEMETLVGKRAAQAGNNRVQERILSTMLNEMDGVGSKLDWKMDAPVAAPNRGTDGQATLELEARDDSLLSSPEHRRHGNPLKVVVVGATNRPDMLDSAILRPGRLDKHIYVPPPDKQARKSILGMYTSKMSCHDLDIDHIVDQTDLYSGADLKNVCKEAGLQAVRDYLAVGNTINEPHRHLPLTHCHFLQALKHVKASLTHQLLQEYKT